MRAWIAAAAVVAATTAAAQSMKSMDTAIALGDMLASEGPCGLAYDHAAIERHIERHVPADDMGFASSLSLMTVGQAAQIEDMSPSAKAAHCAQIRRVARANGFIGG